MYESEIDIEGLDTDRIVWIAVQLQMRLVDTLQEAYGVVPVVGLLENPDPDAGELRAALHQGLVPEQYRPSQQAHIAWQDGIDGAGPSHRLLEQRDHDVDALLFQTMRNFVRPIVKPVKIPLDEGNIVFARLILGSWRRYDDVSPVETVDRVYRIQAPAEKFDIAFAGILVGHELAPLAVVDASDEQPSHRAVAVTGGHPVSRTKGGMNW